MSQLYQDSGSSHSERLAEAQRILTQQGLSDQLEQMTNKERTFVEGMAEATFCTPKQLFWLRDLKDKYCV